MSFDPDAVETITFDSYETIVDVTAVEKPLSDHVDDPSRVARLWRERLLGYAMVGNAIGEYDSFYELIRHALHYALDANSVDLSEDEREETLSTYYEIVVFDDVHDGMERLQDGGYDLYVVSNGNEEMLDSLLDYAGIGDLIEAAISADEVERFKPAPDFYEHAAEKIGTPIESVAFVAAGWWDVPGAINAGMQGIWINRQGTFWGPYETEPDLTVDSFPDLADELGV